MTRLILIRHAPTADTGKRLTGRLPGVPLTARGRAAAATLSEELGAETLTAVYTSPALRCRQTAALLASPRGLCPRVRGALADTHYGEFSGRTLASARRSPLWRQVRAAPSRVRFPGGESLLAVQARAVAACEAAAAAHPEGTVALVTHSDVIACALAHYLGMPFDAFPRLAVASPSASMIDLAIDGPARVVAFGITGRKA